MKNPTTNEDEESQNPESQENPENDDPVAEASNGAGSVASNGAESAASNGAGTAAISSGESQSTPANLRNSNSVVNDCGEFETGAPINQSAIETAPSNSSCDTSTFCGDLNVIEDNQIAMSSKRQEDNHEELVNGIDCSSSSESEALEMINESSGDRKCRKNGVVTVMTPSTTEPTQSSCPSNDQTSENGEPKGKSKSLSALGCLKISATDNEVLSNVVAGIIRSRSMEEDEASVLAISASAAAAAALAAQSNLETIREGEVLEIVEEASAFPSNASPPATVSPVKRGKFIFMDYSVSTDYSWERLSSWTISVSWTRGARSYSWTIRRVLTRGVRSSSWIFLKV